MRSLLFLLETLLQTVTSPFSRLSSVFLRFSWTPLTLGCNLDGLLSWLAFCRISTHHHGNSLCLFSVLLTPCNCLRNTAWEANSFSFSKVNWNLYFNGQHLQSGASPLRENWWISFSLTVLQLSVSVCRSFF